MDSGLVRVLTQLSRSSVEWTTTRGYFRAVALSHIDITQELALQSSSFEKPNVVVESFPETFDVSALHYLFEGNVSVAPPPPRSRSLIRVSLFMVTVSAHDRRHRAVVTVAKPRERQG